MATNAQTIKQFNQNNQQAANQPTAPTAPTPQGGGNQPTTPTIPAPQAQVKLHSRMSASDIALLQKDPATLTKEEAIRRKALETKEVLREQEEEQERQRQAQLEANRNRGRLDRVVMSEAAHGAKAFADATLAPRSWIMRAPTVGGIGALLGIIILFLLAIMPVDKQGNTRLFLIWLTLTGKTSVRLAEGINPNSSTNNNNNNNNSTQPPGTVTGPPPPLPPLPPTPSPVSPDISFTLPAIFQNGTANLLDLFS